MNIPCQPQTTVTQQWKTYLKLAFPTETLGKQMVYESQTGMHFSPPATYLISSSSIWLFFPS